MARGSALWCLVFAVVAVAVAPGLSRSDPASAQSHAGHGKGCDRTCPIAPSPQDAEAVQQIMVSGPFYKIAVETRDRSGALVHRAEGNLVWGERHHIGGTDLRDLGYDRPDYEVNSSLISPQKIWTSL
jgi:hypothetical protein